MAQMRGRETPNQHFGYSNPEHLYSFIFGRVFIETVTVLLVAYISKNTSGRQADVRTCYS